MEVIRLPAEMRKLAFRLRAEEGKLGLVPTMGALHEGHISLIDRAESECQAVVVSIFVNPSQFGPGEDLEDYPRAFEADLEDCRSKGVAVVYAPSPEVMYGEGFDSWVEVPSLAAGLCGPHRPGHFRGVATVVTKLFAACVPERAYFGEKDFQQLVVIRRMAIDLDLGVEVIGCPTVREKDGLAMSSRNVRLSGEERVRALSLIRGLRGAEALLSAGEKTSAYLIRAVREELEGADARIDYVEVVDPDTLEAMERIEESARIAVAARIGSTRLIDNLPLEP